RETPAVPPFIGRRVLADVPLDELIPFIDWTFFFAAWELKGRFPAILEHPQYGTAARELYDNARMLLDRIVREKLLTPSGAYGFCTLVARFEREHDDYDAILVKALADRLAEAFAAWLHAQARADWGIDGGSTPDEIVMEKHRGIRPGFGYPACPDHSEKFKLF